VPAKIQVTQLREGEYLVTIIEGATQSKHHVTLKAADYARLSAEKVPPAELITGSFEFLLEHESKESILPRFDLLEIARYFPSFERDIQKKLRARERQSPD
jgi:hypothetical protein